MKRLKQCKITWVDCKYLAGFCSEFTKITVFFLQNYTAKIHSWTGQMVCHMFKISGVLVQGGLVLASKIFFLENASWLDGRIATF